MGTNMEIVEIAALTSKGQLTIPASIREIFKLHKGSTVMFKVTEKGVLFSPCEIKEKNGYTSEEWKKIECLVAEKGSSYKTGAEAKSHLE